MAAEEKRKDVDELALEERLNENSAYFSKMLNLIPAKYYFVEEADPVPKNGKYMKNKRGKTPKQEVKEASKKAKRLKLNPNAYKTIEDIQKEKEAEEEMEQAKFLSDASKSGTSVRPVQISSVKSTTLEDLRERVQKKITEFKTKRGTRKQHVRGTSNHKGRKKCREKGNHLVRAEQNVTNGATNQSPQKPSVTDENGRIVFSKFDFINPGEQRIAKRSKKDLQKMLAKAEREKMKLEQLSETDKLRKEEQMSWKKALSKVKGEKQQDDPTLIKKTIKRKEKQKKKSHREWKTRMDQVEQQKQRRQEVRAKHIKERIERKKNKKKAKRKPGF